MSIAAVTFTGVVDGKHQCRHSTPADLKRPEPSSWHLRMLQDEAYLYSIGERLVFRK
jgi:hypothetical protein